MPLSRSALSRSYPSSTSSYFWPDFKPFLNRFQVVLSQIELLPYQTYLLPRCANHYDQPFLVLFLAPLCVSASYFATRHSLYASRFDQPFLILFLALLRASTSIFTIQHRSAFFECETLQPVFSDLFSVFPRVYASDLQLDLQVRHVWYLCTNLKGVVEYDIFLFYYLITLLFN